MTYKNIAELNHNMIRLKADLLTSHVVDTLADYYRGSGVEIIEETELHEKISQTLAICLSEIR